MKILPYSQSDLYACLEILNDNIPEFFLPTDRESFAAFLDDLPGQYFVVEEAEGIVACGGWALDAEGVADLTWAMVRRSLHRRGLGSELLRFRLNSIVTNTRAKLVRVRTTQRVQGFFLRGGFRVIDVEVNGYGGGQDKVTMELGLPSMQPLASNRADAG